MASRVALTLGGSFDEMSGAGSITATITPDGALSGNWRLFVVLTESDIFESFPNGIDTHHDVFRRFVPGTDETPIQFSGAADPPIVLTLPFEKPVQFRTHQSVVSEVAASSYDNLEPLHSQLLPPHL